MTIPVIDIEKTSVNLRQFRESRKIKISQLQTLFNMTNPQSIYNWENPEMKNLPRIDNLVILAKFYDVKIDDLITIKEENQNTNYISEPRPSYDISEDSLLFIKEKSSTDVLRAIQRYYRVSIYFLSY